MTPPRPRSAPAWRRYLRFWGSDPRRDLDDELRFHLESRFDEFVSMGMDPARARDEVGRRFGDVAAVRDQCKTIDSQWTRERAMSNLLSVGLGDVRYAFRQLRRNPSLTIAAILCFALGIGANTSIFSVVDAVLFRPLPFPDADRLVLIGEALPEFAGTNMGTISTAEYTDYRGLDGRVFESSAIYDNGSFVLSGNGEPERIRGAVVSAGLFKALRVAPALGRTFLPGEDRLGAPNLLVLSDKLWRRRFNADPGVLGTPVMMDGAAWTVIGIMPPGFAFPLAGIGNTVAEVFAPFPITADDERMRGNSYNTHLVARLAPGVTLEAARLAVAGVAKRFPELHPGVYGPRHTTIADVFSLREQSIGPARRPLLVLFAAVGLVLMIACINVSSLLLARAAARRRELSVRRALGASRSRLIRQFLAESLVLTSIGGALGVAFATWGARALASRAPQSLLQGYSISVDARVLLVTAGVAIGAAVVVSLLPALQQPEGSLATTLREEGRSASGAGSSQRARRSLVVSEIALALVLATGAGLMIKSFLNARRVAPGFTPERLLAFRLDLPAIRYPSASRITGFERDMMERLRSLPGVKAATVATTVPTTGTWHLSFSIEGRDLARVPLATNTLVFPGYFETLQIPMRAGRPFAGTESPDSPPVAIVNETLARQFFPGVSAVGKRIKWGSPTSPSPWATIIGVSADVKATALDTPEEPAVYFPAAQRADSHLVTFGMRQMAYVVRTDGDPKALFNTVRRAVREADAELPVINLAAVDDLMALSVAGRRFNTALLGAFALLALALAAVGVYGLMAYAVVQRTREIGIRVAIGATPGSVLRLVVGQGTRVALAGVLLGLVGSLVLMRLMRTQLFDVSPLDPVTFVAAAGTLLGVAMLATYLPARRAARIDPLSAIRAE